MGNDRLQNRILSVFFLAFLLLSFVLNGFWPAAVDGSALEGVSLRPDRFLAAVKLGFLENLWAEDAFIKLNGSVELGPIVELADVIVDIVETGSTLKANRLDVLEEVLPISARMIVNQVSMQMKTERIREMIDRLRDCLT